MKVIQADGGLLTNSEVVEVLQDREADKQAVVSKALPSEIKAYQSLLKLLKQPSSREQVEAFVEATKRFAAERKQHITRLELVNLLNQQPTSSAQLHQCIEDIDDRFGPEDLEELLRLIEERLLK